jgi:hypothetical protein
VSLPFKHCKCCNVHESPVSGNRHCGFHRCRMSALGRSAQKGNAFRCCVCSKIRIEADASKTVIKANVVCGCIWTPPNCNGLFGSGFEVAIADVYPASLDGPIYRSREPRWISACFPLIAPKASMLTLPIHTSGSRNNGCDPFPSPGRCCNIPEIALLISAYRYGFQLNDTS